MMLSTKARRVSVGARAGNARRSALRRGCGERFRTWAVARAGGLGAGGASRARGEPGSDRRRRHGPGLGPEQPTPGARGLSRGNPGRTTEGPEPIRGESGCRRPEIRSRRTFCRRPKTPRRRAREPAFAAGLGPANGLAAGLGEALRLRECRRAGPALLPREPGRLARWFGGKARRNPERIPEGLETPRPGQPTQRTAARRTARKEFKPTQKRRSRLPCPGTFRKRNTLP